MDSQKIYLLAEITVLPEFLDDVKGASSEHSFLRFKRPVVKECSRRHGRATRIS